MDVIDHKTIYCSGPLSLSPIPLWNLFSFIFYFFYLAFFIYFVSSFFIILFCLNSSNGNVLVRFFAILGRGWGVLIWFEIKWILYSTIYGEAMGWRRFFLWVCGGGGFLFVCLLSSFWLMKLAVVRFLFGLFFSILDQLLWPLATIGTEDACGTCLSATFVHNATFAAKSGFFIILR